MHMHTTEIENPLDMSVRSLLGHAEKCVIYYIYMCTLELYGISATFHTNREITGLCIWRTVCQKGTLLAKF